MTPKNALLSLVMLMSFPVWAVTTISSEKEEYLHANVRVPRRYRFERRRKNLPQKTDPILENEHVSMSFDAEKGHLRYFIDKKTKRALLSDKKLAWPIIFRLGCKLGDQDLSWTDSRYASRFSYNHNYGEKGQEFEGTWTYEWERARAEVVLMVSLPNEASLSRWNIRVDITGDAILEQAMVPILSGIGRLGDSAEDDHLLVPERLGRLFKNPFEKLKWWGQIYPCAFANMQFIAFYDNRVGLYLASLDTKGLSKTVAWDNWEIEDKKPASMKIHYHGLSSTGNSKSFQTEVAIGIFHGDWTDAASIYRDWAEKQSWAKVTIKNKGTPSWLTEIGIGKDYHVYDLDRDTKVYKNKWKDYSDWVLKTTEHQQFFSIPTAAMLWGWEHGGTWAYGDYFPPIGGWRAFDEAVGKLRDLKCYPFLFIGAKTVRDNSPTWNLDWCQRAAAINDRGMTFQDRDKFMCLESEEWLGHLRQVSHILAEHDVGIIQLDGFPWAPYKKCYSKKHAHSTIPGCGTRPYKIIEKMLNLRSEVQAVHPEIALAGEGGDEQCIPVLDMFYFRDCWAEIEDRLNVRSGLAKVVPLLQFVYHPYVIFYDNYGWGPWENPLNKSSSRRLIVNYHHLALGRAFIWGGIPSYNMQDWLKERKSQPVFTFLKQCSKARVGYLRDFLVFGRMLPPPDVNSPLVEVESPDKSFRGKVHSALTSAWQSEKDDVAIIILNIGENLLKSTLSLSAYKEHIQPGSKMEIYLNNDLSKATTFSKNQYEQSIELKSLEFTAFILRSTDNGNTDLTKHTIKDNYKSSQNPLNLCY